MIGFCGRHHLRHLRCHFIGFDLRRRQLSLREQMWSHFKDAITGEHGRAARDHRYPVPMGQETFVNPGHARELLYADWTANWIPTRLRSVTAAPAPRAR